MSLPAPATLTITSALSKNSLSWAAVVGADGYRVYRRPNAVAATYILIADITATSWIDYVPNYDLSDPSSTALAVYDYKVAGYDGTGDGAYMANEGITMPDITTTDIQNAGIDHPPYNDGTDKTASYTITNSAGSGSVTSDAKAMHEARMRGMDRYFDEKTNP